MSQFILDANSIHTLTALTQPVDLCDPSGKVLGHFVPRIRLAEWEIVGSEPNPDELSKREQSQGKRYSTAEVLSHLESLS